jgi:hypothetical protein
MKEIVEFRIAGEFASLLFSENEGVKLANGLVRKIEIETSDPRYQEIGRLQRELKASHGKPFYYGENVKRTYTASEIKSAELFKLSPTKFIEPAGEECGTKYDEGSACPLCGSGASIDGPFYFNTKKIPKGTDLVSTIASELFISKRALDLFKSCHISGYNADPIFDSPHSSVESENWFLLRPETSDISIISPTKIGVDLFGLYQNDPNSPCPQGDLLGLNLLSTVTIQNKSSEKTDILATKEFIGTRRGLLRPRPIILVSPKFHNIFKQELKGADFEVAYQGDSQNKDSALECQNDTHSSRIINSTKAKCPPQR